MFIDTSGWAAASDESQTHHAQAGEQLRTVQHSGDLVVTTNYVLAELTALLTRPIRMPRVKQYRFLQAIRSSDWVEIVHIDPALDALAWKLWEDRPDKDWSLVDCASFVVMQARGLTAALTSDRHFEQAGFATLLRITT